MMKPMLWSAAFAGALVLFAPAVRADMSIALPQAAAEQVGMSKQKLDRIRPALQREIDEGKLAGTVVMVARKGKLVYADALASRTRPKASRWRSIRYSASIR